MEESENKLLLASDEKNIRPSTCTKPAIIILIIFCFIEFSFYFATETSVPLEAAFKNAYNITNREYSILSSADSIPNIIFPMFSGFLLDRIGSRVSLVLFIGILCAGEFLYALSSVFKAYIMAVIGRAIYGIGLQINEIASNSLLSLMFIGGPIALAITLVDASECGAMIISENFQSWLFKEEHSIIPCLFSSFGVCILAFLIAFVIIRLLKQFTSNLVVEKKEEFRFSQLLHMPAAFYFLIIGGGFFYGASYSMDPYLVLMIQRRFIYSNQSATFYHSLVNFVNIFAEVGFAVLIGFVGKRPIFLISGILSEIISLLILCLLPNTHHLYFVISNIGLGLAYSLFVGAYWSMIPYIVKKEYLGTAFGIAESINNLFRFLLIMGMGKLEPSLDISNLVGYTYMLVLGMIVSIIALALCCIIVVLDKKDSYRIMKIK